MEAGPEPSMPPAAMSPHATPMGAAEAATTVSVRFRPRSSKEADAWCVEYNSESQITFSTPDGDRNAFTFDRIYGTASSEWPRC